jgi:hypothetical protein
MQRHYETLIIILAVILSGCVNGTTITSNMSSTDLCDKRIIDGCKSCSPYMERLRIVTNELDETKFTEVKQCGDLSAQLSKKESKLFDVTMKGCISNNIVLDKETKDRLFTELDRAQVPQAEYDVWLSCYNRVVGAKPIVVIMDSHLKDVVYCKHTQDIGGSNAVDIQELIDDLAITPIPISTHLEWQQDQQVMNLQPKLLIIHASAFYKETRAMDGNKRLIDFLYSLKNSGVKILVYTRGLPDQPREDVAIRWNRIIDALNDPVLKSDAQLFVVPKGRDKDSCFTDPDVGREFTNKVKEMLSPL